MASHGKNVNTIDPLEGDLASRDKEVQIVQAEQPLSVQDKEIEEIVAQEQEVNPGLPFSKARAIALVVTVTAASFLNVRVHADE